MRFAGNVWLTKGVAVRRKPRQIFYDILPTTPQQHHAILKRVLAEGISAVEAPKSHGVVAPSFVFVAAPVQASSKSRLRGPRRVL